MKKLHIIPVILMLAIATSACVKATPEKTDHVDAEHDMRTMSVQSEQEFLAMMIPHHQEAVDTAKVILAKSTNAELKTMAQNIVDSQTTEIAQMQTWGKEWFGKDFAASQAYEAMMPELSTLEGEALDQAFIAGMIHHHEGAIQMAQELKMLETHEETASMADDIIEAQTVEIEKLDSWLK